MDNYSYCASLDGQCVCVLLTNNQIRCQDLPLAQTKLKISIILDVRMWCVCMWCVCVCVVCVCVCE